MTFAPLIPLSGYAGWTFLNRTLEDQAARYADNPASARDMAYFRENIGSVANAEDLVSDFRMLRVALGAYGLENDLPNKAFIQKVLSDGVTADDALSNRLADKRYRAFSEAFGFGSQLPPRTQSPGFASKLLDRFERMNFERAVGDQDPDMRLALTAQRELPEIAARDVSDTTGWLTILGNPPLREVFETALGLPSGIGAIDLDQQVEAFQDAAARTLGHDDIASFSDPQAIETLLRNFTVRAQIANGPSPLTPGVTALTLLQSFN